MRHTAPLLSLLLFGISISSSPVPVPNGIQAPGPELSASAPPNGSIDIAPRIVEPEQEATSNEDSGFTGLLVTETFPKANLIEDSKDSQHLYRRTDQSKKLERLVQKNSEFHEHKRNLLLPDLIDRNNRNRKTAVRRLRKSNITPAEREKNTEWLEELNQQAAGYRQRVAGLKLTHAQTIERVKMMMTEHPYSSGLYRREAEEALNQAARFKKIPVVEDITFGPA